MSWLRLTTPTFTSSTVSVFSKAPTIFPCTRRLSTSRHVISPLPAGALFGSSSSISTGHHERTKQFSSTSKCHGIGQFSSNQKCHGTRQFSSSNRDTNKSSAQSLKVPSATLPSAARVVIVGGGVVGTSVAFHLAERGWTDIVVLEQGKLTCGTTWHSAGGIGRMRFTHSEFELIDYSASLYKQWEEEGEGVGWKESGSLNVARTKDRMTLLKRINAIGKSLGVECPMVMPSEMKDLCPFMRTEDLEGGIWIPGDGVLTAPDVAMVFAKKAKAKGVKVLEGVGAKRVHTENCRVKKVETTAGDVECEYFVNAAGMWSRELGLRTTPQSVNVPLHACEHYYLVTKPMKDISPMTPFVRDYDGHIYFREWGGGLLAGGYEPVPKLVFPDGPPDKFEFQLMQEDWDHFQILMDQILYRIPHMETAEIRQLVSGPESFTPDANWLLGETAEVDNYFVATGMNSKGIAVAGGVGRSLAEWIVDGRPSVPLWAQDIRRFQSHHNTKGFLRNRVEETFTGTASVRYPREEYTMGRPLLSTPLQARLEKAGGVFGETTGFERPLYFKPGNEVALPEDLRGNRTFSKPPWFEAVREETKACKERVAVMDMSSFAKFELQSSNDEVVGFLQYLCSNNIDVDVGNVVHTGMHNEKGGYENDATIARLSHNSFLMICPAAQLTRASAWLRRHMPSHNDGTSSNAIQVKDVTSTFSSIGIIGPHAQQLMADISATNTLDSMTCRKIDIGDAKGVLAMRLTHTGEDGFILYIPSQHALKVYDLIMNAGKDYGVSNAGHYAFHNLRVENSLATWGQDIDNNSTPLECGRGSLVKFDKGDFIGKAALERQRDQGVPTRLVHFQLQDHDLHRDLWLWGGEPIYRNGRKTGMTTSCGFGFSPSCGTVCLGFVSDCGDDGKQRPLQNIDDFVMKADAKYEIDISGITFQAKPTV